MKKLFNKPSKRQMFYCVLTMAVLASAGYSIWQTWLIRDDIGQLYTKVYDESVENYDESYNDKASDTKVSYKILKQYVENLDVADPESFSFKEDTKYILTPVRVVEVEVTNNEDWVYSAYNSIGTVDEGGRLTRTINVRTSQDKNYNSNGYGLELIPGGRGVMYLYFEDSGEEITKLYNADASQEINLN